MISLFEYFCLIFIKLLEDYLVPGFYKQFGHYFCLWSHWFPKANILSNMNIVFYW